MTPPVLSRRAFLKTTGVITGAAAVRPTRVLAHSDGFRDPALPEPTHRFLATGDPEPFERLGRRFLGPEIGRVLQSAPARP